MSVSNPFHTEIDTQETVDVHEYHHRTKHTLERYARGPDGLDWDTQPDPFRTYAGSERIALPLCAGNIKTQYSDLYHLDRLESATLTLENISALFELSMGLSSWKIHGALRWAVRNNPSSGNLHPTESYLVFPGTSEIPAGVHHYHVYRHSLEHRCSVDKLDAIEKNSFLIGFSSIHWREAWKYGERAYRYCQLDVGHAVAAMRYAAATLGWTVKLLDSWSDAQIAGVLGLDNRADGEQAETESPDVMLQINCKPNDDKEITPIYANALIEQLSGKAWHGKPNRLSPASLISWKVIDKIDTHCIKPVTEPDKNTPADKQALAECKTELDAVSVIRKRRSTQAFDGKSILPLSSFYRILDCLQTRDGTPPFDSLPWAPRVHLVLFVHRVDGLQPGMYVLPRSETGEKLLRKNLREQFDWTRAPVCPEWLPLYHLVSANSRNAARTISCHQSIAADSAFSLSMVAEFDATVNDTPWRYRQLFWEAGMIGHALYLEAEAAGISGTGIGCFFDDTVHDILGIKNTTLQSMYHFTVGTAIKDKRLVSLPPYGHLHEPVDDEEDDLDEDDE